MGNKFEEPIIEKLEIYRQRYETFRHLDKLRWQMLQIAVAAGSVVLAFSRDGSSSPGWWALLATGIILLILAFAMVRIIHGIIKNGEVLHSIGNLIGDKSIPKPSWSWKSSSFWIVTIMAVVGVILIVFSLELLLKYTK